ncbi:MAG: hypothetical protein ACLUOI_13245 [Eisenbergiella sp.]
MGKKDITLQDFLGDPYIFADLFNGCCFGGEQVIHAEELSPLDSVQCTKDNRGTPGKRARDIKSSYTASHRQPFWRWRTRVYGLPYGGQMHALRCG